MQITSLSGLLSKSACSVADIGLVYRSFVQRTGPY